MNLADLMFVLMALVFGGLWIAGIAYALWLRSRSVTAPLDASMRTVGAGMVLVASLIALVMAVAVALRVVQHGLAEDIDPAPVMSSTNSSH